MNEQFNKNAKVEKCTTMLGIAVRLIVIDPLYYLYSLDDWAVGSTDRSIFVQEMVLHERLLGICYNSLENFK